MKCPNCKDELVFVTKETVVWEESAVLDCHNTYCKISRVLVVLEDDKQGGPVNVETEMD